MTRRPGRMQQAILEVLRQHGQSQSAYALLGHLRKDHPSLAPTSVYRALAALTDNGTIHRIESTKAFVACTHGTHTDGCLLAICEECGIVEEHVTPKLIDDVSAETAKSGFTPRRHVIEVHGCCAHCTLAGAAE